MLDSQQPVWLSPPAEMDLVEGRVDLWRASLDCSTSVRQSLWRSLSEDEKERAGRYKHDQDREHFITRRGILRILLAKYLQSLPIEIRLSRNAFGKVMLVENANPIGLEFNASHSEGMVLFAFAYRRRVGVDLEKIRDNPEVLKAARRYLSVYENAVLASLPQEARMKAFYECWTRKEAFLKAQGTGLMMELTQFDVSFGPGQQPQILEIRGEVKPRGHWRVEDISVGGGFSAALVVDGHDFDINYWQFSFPD